MSIVGDHPESGVRFVLERTDAGAYEGTAFTKDARYALVLRVATDGSVEVSGEHETPAELLEQARLLVRTAVRHAERDGTEPPRRLLRWRA